VIVIDTSALVAIALNEPMAGACREVLENASALQMSAGTLAETLIVAGRRGLSTAMAETVGAFGITIAPVGEADARRAADAYAKWGKGVHPAGLNLGDCFAYALAQERNCPLLYVGEDFAKTDVRGVDLAKGAGS
jgi:ribonuclease VapC